MLFALGGGVVGDITGFAAATYLRGIDFVQIPTTLLAQVDSSVGGKTGVDFDQYKNMVGAFYMPKLVYMNLSVLKTLDDRQYYAGMGEVMKYGLIKNASFYEWILDNMYEIHERAGELDELAHAAAEDSMLGSGIGMSGQRIAMQMRRLPKGHNVFELNAPRFWQCRNLGANSARAVKKMPFKAIYRGE